MSEARKIKHSPGPWMYDSESVWDADNCYVCSRVTPGNGRVIAAVPDMLRLLRVLRDGLDEYWESQNAAIVSEASELIDKLDAGTTEPEGKR